MIVADSKHSLQITGNGDVLEPHDGIIGEVILQAELCKSCSSNCSIRLSSRPVRMNVAQQSGLAAHMRALHRGRCAKWTAWMRRQ